MVGILKQRGSFVQPQKYLVGFAKLGRVDPKRSIVKKCPDEGAEDVDNPPIKENFSPRV